MPSVRTSQIVDIPLQLARWQDPDAGFTETRQIVSPEQPMLKANLTAHFSFPSSPKKTECPEGYRLDYQGFCINITDELADDANAGVRGPDPVK